jgi:HEPN domain-containing protein
MQPDEAKQKLIASWLLKARQDTAAAVLLRQQPELLEVAIYHSQQAAAKALKGYLLHQETWKAAALTGH